MTKAEILAATEQAQKQNLAAAEKLTDSVLLTDYAPLAENGIWSDALQTAVNGHNRIIIPAGVYAIDRTILIPSDRILTGEGENSVLRMENMTTILMRNIHTQDGTKKPVSGERDRNITVSRLRIEENAPARRGYGSTGKYDENRSFFGVSTCLFFNNMDGLTVDNVTFVRCAGFAVQTGDITDAVFTHIRFEHCFADGLHLNGNSKNLLVRDVKGFVGDDLVALNMYDWQNSSVNWGVTDTVLCEDLELSADSKYKAIRIEPGVYRYEDGSTVDCALYNCIFRRVKGIKTFKIYFQTPRYKLTGKPEWGAVGSADWLYFEDMDIDLDTPIDRFPEYMNADPVRGTFAAFEVGANIGHMTLSDIRLTLHREQFPMSYLLCVGPKSVRSGEWEIFDPYLSSTLGELTLTDISAPVSDLTKEISFDNINADGFSTASGKIGKIVG